MRHCGTVGADRIVHQGRLQKAIGRMKVVEIETRAKAIVLILEFDESQILHRHARKRTGQPL